jgi:hypothetical protein
MRVYSVCIRDFTVSTIVDFVDFGIVFAFYVYSTTTRSYCATDPGGEVGNSRA